MSAASSAPPTANIVTIQIHSSLRFKSTAQYDSNSQLITIQLTAVTKDLARCGSWQLVSQPNTNNSKQLTNNTNTNLTCPTWQRQWATSKIPGTRSIYHARKAARRSRSSASLCSVDLPTIYPVEYGARPCHAKETFQP